MNNYDEKFLESVDNSKQYVYNYHNSMKETLIDFISEDWVYVSEKIGYSGSISEFVSDETYKEYISELLDLIAENDVTGNITGSYWCSGYKAELALFLNKGLLSDALEDMGYMTHDGSLLCSADKIMDPEWCDLIIREYVLLDSLYAAINEIAEKLQN